MTMKYFVFGLLLGMAFLTGPLRANDVLDCDHTEGGGEGPGPMFEDISSSLITGIKSIKTSGSLQDFIYLEKRNQVVYRNSVQELWSVDLSTDESSYLGDRGVPLSRQIDSEENYAAADAVPGIVDLKTGQPYFYSGPGGLIEHLFWGKNSWGATTLFSLGARTRSEMGQTYRFYSYIPGNTNASSCTVNIPHEYRLVRGTTKPLIVLYKEEIVQGGRQITFQRFTAQRKAYGEECRRWGTPRTVLLPKISSAATLQGAYYFTAMQSTGFQYDTSSRNLVWVKWDALGMKESSDRKDGVCQTYSLPSVRPVFLSETQPILATPNRKKGFNLFYLEKNKKGNLALDSLSSEVDLLSMWISTKGDRLLFSTQPKYDDARREITQVFLKNPK